MRFAPVIAIAAGGALLGGCSSYTLSGRVIKGDASYVALVNPDDPRLDDEGIPGVSLTLVMDPTRLNRKTIAQGVSQADGSISLGVDEFGAGMLELDTELTARKKGAEPAQGFFRLPGSGKKRVLVSLGPGEDRDLNPERENLRDQADQYWR